MEDTLDVWEIPPESATRIGHPAPFPLELPERLIQLYTYSGDLVLDPFLGAGTTALASLRQGRHYVGYDLDANCTSNSPKLASRGDERSTIADKPSSHVSLRFRLRQADAAQAGKSAKDLAIVFFA